MDPVYQNIYEDKFENKGEKKYNFVCVYVNKNIYYQQRDIIFQIVKSVENRFCEMSVINFVSKKKFDTESGCWKEIWQSLSTKYDGRLMAEII